MTEQEKRDIDKVKDLMAQDGEPIKEPVQMQPGIMNIAASAYRAYGWNRDWKDWRGGPMPQWDALTPGIQTAWCCAAQQAIDISRGGSYGLNIEQKWKGV